MKSRFPKALGPLLILCGLSALTLFGQTPPRTEGGASTGTPANYTAKRTAGIIDPKGPLVFEDATEKTTGPG